MKIALFTDADVFAGTERHIFDLSVALAALGHSVVVACPVPAPLADRCAAAGIRVVPVAKRRMPDFAAIKILAAELRTGRVDIIHAHNGRTHLLAVAAVKRAGRGRVVATQHFLAPNRTGRSGPKAWLANQLHRWAERNTAAFIAISKAVKDQMLLRGDAPAEKITVVHNGTGEPEATTPERIAELRVELGVGDRPMVFCAARLQKEKDVPTLINAFTALAAASMRRPGGLNETPGAPGLMRRPSGLNEADAAASLKTNDSADIKRCEAPGLIKEAAGDRLIKGEAEGSSPVSLSEAAHCNASPALPKHSRFEVLDSNSLSSSALPKVLISDQCSLVIERSATLLLAGEGDQRAECERLIASRITDHGSRNNDDQKLGVRSEELEDATKNPESRSKKQEGNLEFQKTERSAAEYFTEVPARRDCFTKDMPAGQTSVSLSAAFHCSAVALLGFRRDVSALMSACDIFVSPCPVEAFGLVLIEAMALGKPVIAAAAGGPLEIVADGETGLLFEPGNAENLAQAIKRLLDDPELRQRMGKAGRKRYEEHFTARRMAAGVLAAYAAAARHASETASP